jgi:hypothetical protein
MKRIATALALSTLCLAVSACGGPAKYTAEFIPTPPERLVCERTGTRPTLPPEYQIDWGHITSVPQAKAEVVKLVQRQHERERIVAGYVLQVEGVNFICFNNMQWRRDFEADLAKKHPPAQ